MAESTTSKYAATRYGIALVDTTIFPCGAASAVAECKMAGLDRRPVHMNFLAMQSNKDRARFLVIRKTTPNLFLRYVARIQQAQDELQYLHEELSSYVAPISLDPEECSIEALFGEVLNEISELNREFEIRLQVSGGDFHCELDKFHISQVFRNIVENSLAVCPNPLKIHLNLRKSQLHGRAAITLLYRDNGSGFDQKQREHVFDRCYTTKPKRTELGMAIANANAKRIIEAHGGQISVSNTPTCGAEFVITLLRQMS